MEGLGITPNQLKNLLGLKLKSLGYLEACK